LLGALGLVLAGLWISTRAFARVRATEDLVTRTHVVLGELDRLQVVCRDTSGGAKSFSISGNKKAYNVFRHGANWAPDVLKRLRLLTADNLDQQQRVVAIEPMLSRFIAFNEEGIRQRETLGFNLKRESDRDLDRTLVLSAIQDLIRR